MTTKRIDDRNQQVLARRVAGLTVVLVVALVTTVVVSGCARNDVQTAAQETRIGLDEEQVPIDFNPPFEMSYFSGQQALMQRGSLRVSDVKYLATEKSAHANFRIQDILSDRVFVAQGSGSKRLAELVKQTHKGAVKAMGEFGESQRLEFQHYLLEVDRACVMVIKYAGADGAGDITSAGVPRGSIAMLADFCEAGTEHLTAKRRQQWIDSFRYRTI